MEKPVMIDPESTILSLASAIASAPNALPPRAELTEAGNLLTMLETAAANYRAASAALTNANAAWLASYRVEFELLDRRARYVLSRKAAPTKALRAVYDAARSPLAFDDGVAAHDALAARAEAASKSSAPAAALTELEGYRERFKTSWEARPEPDSAALTAAMSAASEMVRFLTWAKDHPV